MNRTITDPVLSTFRKPLAIRLREKLDEKQAVIDAQATAIAKMSRENRRLTKELTAMAERAALAERFVTGGGDNRPNTPVNTPQEFPPL